ncbi:hypothetical protein LCGC14_0792170 [marine sediment metagenome]|uniref:Uncharacterized protein n=1 Tax=marine sediment metagenome TaxID=412755 RepID=A0A0F9QC11_9ZZZZ
MLLAGSNNCYEVGQGGRSGRRVRSWEATRYYNRKDKISEKPEVILKKLDAELRRRTREHLEYQKANYPKEEWVKPAHIRNHFGYYSSIVVGSGRCHDTSWDRYRSQFTNGIKNAVTIEELDKLGVNLNIHYYSYNDDSPNGKPVSVDIKTEQEYFIELKKWREWQASSGKMFYLSFHPSSTDAVLHRLRMLRDSKRKPPREKTRVEQGHYFVLTNGNGNLVKYTSRGYRHSYSQTGGKQFRTEDIAEKYRQQLVNKERYQAETWKVKRVDQATSFLV